MRRIKVLQFPIANSKGGITQYVLQNWRFIDKEKFQFDFATMSKSLDFADVLEKEGSKIHYISCYAEDDRERFIYEFKRILTKEKYDIVHLHTKQWKSFLVEQIAKQAGVKRIIIHAHSTGIDTLDKKKREEEIQLHNQILDGFGEDIATDFWACSKKAADFIFGDKIPQSKIKIMHNAIDLSKYTFNHEIRELYRKELGIEDGDCIIGNVGRFAFPKNQEFLIKVFATICEETKIGKRKYKLLLVGAGEREEKYKKMVCEYGLSQSVIFTGFRTDIPELLQAMDIFCLPSRFEGLPISIVEAQASGLVCIVSDTITREVSLTENVHYCKLEVDEWVKSIFRLAENLPQRIDISFGERNDDFDIRKQIKVVEDEYVKGKYEKV